MTAPLKRPTFVAIPVRGSDRPALVDVEDARRVLALVWRAAGGRPGQRYAATSRPGAKTGGGVRYLHHFVLGRAPSRRLVVDHRNGDRMDCRKSNLRMATPSQNQWHRSGPQRNNTSGVSGVHYYAARRKWLAYIHIGGRRRHLGCFPRKAQAVVARRNAERELFGALAPGDHR